MLKGYTLLRVGASMARRRAATSFEHSTRLGSILYKLTRISQFYNSRVLYYYSMTLAPIRHTESLLPSHKLDEVYLAFCCVLLAAVI